MNLNHTLTLLGACKEAREWARNKTIEQAVTDCHRGDWLLWLAQNLDCDIRLLTLAKARSAATVKHLMKDERSIRAIEVAELFGLGQATCEELDDAATAAYAATAATTAFAVYAADPADPAATAAYAAYATATTAYAAATTAYAAAAAAARIENQKQTADICRSLLGEFLISEVNKSLNP